MHRSSIRSAAAGTGTAIVMLFTLLASSVVSAQPAAAQTVLLPDLVSDAPVPVTTQVIGAGGDNPGQLVVRFHGYVTNLGDGPLDIAGNPQLANPADPNSHSVYQRGLLAGADRNSESSYVNLNKAIVQYETDDGHNHFHLMEISRYSLWNGDKTAEVAPGMKVGFCLYDVTSQGGRHPNPGPYFYDGARVRWCASNNPGATDIRMGTTEGWRDVYSSNLTFQWVDVSDVSPGSYWLASESDTGNRIAETDETNNGIVYSDNPVVVPGYVATARSATVQAGTNSLTLVADRYGNQGGQQFMITEAPRHGTLNVTTGANLTSATVVYTPNPGYSGPDSFRYIAKSANSAFPLNPPEATYALSVGNNAVSVAISGNPASMVAGTSVNLSAAVSNAANTVNWSVNGIAGGNSTVGTINSSGLYVAPSNPPGAGAVTIRATSTVAPAAFDEVSVAITAANTAPSIVATGNQSSTVGDAVNLQLRANDPGDTVTWQVSNLPAGLTWNAQTGLISGSPTTAQTRTVTVIATDTGALTDTETFVWSVAPAVGGSVQLVTSSASYNAGWVLRNGTKQWISSSCRTQLEAAGGAFAVTQYNTFGSLPAANPALSCNQVQGLLAPQGEIPTRPTNLSASVVNGQVVLTWSPSSDNNGLREYEVKRDDVWIGYTSAPGTSFTDTNPTGVHLYEIRAVDFDLNYSPSAAITVDASGGNAAVQLVTTSASYSAGWALVNGTKQWISDSCRNSLEAAGGAFEIVAYNTFGGLDPASPSRSCGELVAMLNGGNPNVGDASLVTTSASYTAGWLLVDGTKQWLSAQCRTQLEAGGASFAITSYNDFGSRPAASPALSCSQIAALL